MPILPSEFTSIILAFAPLFFNGVWRCAQVLLLGAILAPGKRTVTSALRVMGLSDEPQFQIYHRVLNRAVWSCRHASLILLRLLVAAFVPTGPVVLGLDDTIERRWGPKIAARGIYRDPVRSSDSHFVKASGLRWLSLMLLAPIPWAGRVWALPFLTALAPSERYWKRRKRRPKLLTDWSRQLVLQVQRWLPTRTLGPSPLSICWRGWQAGGGPSFVSPACVWTPACFARPRRVRKAPRGGLAWLEHASPR